MTAKPEQRHSWIRIGATYGAVVSGAIAALVYHAGVQRGARAGRSGEQAEAGPGWYLVWVDEPHRHYQLSAPAAPAGAQPADFEKNALAALAEAGEAIENKIGRGNSGGPDGR